MRECFLILQFILTLLATSQVASAKDSDVQCEADLTVQWAQMQNTVSRSDFTTVRDFAWYERDFKAPTVPLLTELLKSLPRNSTWMDFSAGRARAMRDN